MSNILIKKQAEFQFVIRTSQKQRMFCMRRQKILKNQQIEQLESFFLQLINNSNESHSLKMKIILQKLIRSSTHQLPYLSEALVSILKLKPSFFNAHETLIPFIQLIKIIMVHSQLEQKRQVIRIGVQQWLFKALISCPFEQTQMIEDIYVLLSRLKQVSKFQSNLKYSIAQDVLSKIIEIATSHITKHSKMMLSKIFQYAQVQLGVQVGKKLKFYAQFLYEQFLQNPEFNQNSLNNLLLLQIGCWINMEDKQEIVNYLILNFHLFQTEKMLQFISIQTKQSCNIYYQNIRDVLLDMKNELNSDKSFISLFRTLKNVIINENYQFQSCNQIYRDFIHEKVENYIQIPLINSLTQLFSTMQCLQFIFQDSRLSQLLVKCLNIGKFTIEFKTKQIILLILLQKNQIQEYQIHNLILPEDIPQFWQYIEHINRQYQEENDYCAI